MHLAGRRIYSLLAFIVLSGCESAPLSPLDRALQETPRENEEAEEIALLLSDKLVAPENLYLHVQDDLATIRALYGDSLPVDSILFRPACRSGAVDLELEPTAVDAIRAGTFTAFDSLNRRYEATAMDTSSIRYTPSVSLFFRGRLDSKRLSEIYASSPAVQAAYPYYRFWFGSMLYVRNTSRGRGYLFYKGWGDCPAGCIYKLFWYFRSADGAIEYVGAWNPREQPEPSWWPEAGDAIELRSACGK